MKKNLSGSLLLLFWTDNICEGSVFLVPESKIVSYGLLSFSSRQVNDDEEGKTFPELGIHIHDTYPLLSSRHLLSSSPYDLETRKVQM